ncbi:MAG: hypothetical protein H8E44_34240, partial [Planctomycetes bacterium]|nr:hypothetical protein [Planctomycetota bacterium]
MNRACSLLLPLGAILVMSHATPAATTIELDLSTTNQVEARELGNGACSIETRGGDPYVMCKPISGTYDPDRELMLSFDYFCAKGLDFIEVFYGPPIIAGQSAQGPPVLSSEGWTSYAFSIKEKQKPGSWKGGYTLFRLDFGRRPGRVIQIGNIQLRAPTAYELKLVREREAMQRARDDLELKMQGLVTQQHGVAIEQVKATADTIVIAVNTTAAVSNRYLCEVPVYQTPVG